MEVTRICHGLRVNKFLDDFNTATRPRTIHGNIQWVPTRPQIENLAKFMSELSKADNGISHGYSCGYIM